MRLAAKQQRPSLERRRARDDLRAALPLASVLDGVAEPVVLLEPDTSRPVFANRAMLRRMGVSAVAELDAGSLFSPQRLADLTRRLAQGELEVEHTLNGQSVSIALQLIRQGERQWVSATIRPSRGAEAPDFALEALLDSSPSAIIVRTLTGNVSAWNRAAEQLYGWTARETVYAPPPFDEPALTRQVRSVLQHGGRRAFPHQRQCRDGSWVRLNVTLSPLCDEHGQIDGVLEVAEDVTSRSHAELLASNRRMHESRESERLELARELHDGPLQSLLAVGLSLTDLAKNYDAELVREQQAEILRVARDLRRLVSGLRPAGLEEFGLIASLEGWVSKAVRDTPSGPDVDLDLQEIPELTTTQQRCFFRIAQEALINCLRHSDARSVTVRLCSPSPAEVTLDICDDGVGFLVPFNLATLNASGHRGLVGMAERAQHLGGELSIRSRPGQGTHVRVTVLLDQPQ